MKCSANRFYQLLSWYWTLNGLTTFYYEMPASRLVESKCLTCYCLLLQCFASVGLVQLIHLYMQRGNYVVVVFLLCYAAILALCIHKCWLGKHRMLQLLRKLLQLECKYLKVWPKSLNSCLMHSYRLGRLFFMKLALVSLGLVRINVFYPIYLQRYLPDNAALSISYAVVVNNIIIALTLQYYCILWQLCRLCWLLNVQLRLLLAHRRCLLRQTRTLKELHHLQRLYMQLQRLNKVLTEHFQYILICLVACKGCYLIYYGFQIFVMIVASNVEQKMRVFIIGSYLIDALNVYFTCNLAHQLAELMEETSFILRVAMLRKCETLHKKVLLFALQLSNNLKYVSILNVFRINRQLTLKIFAKALLFTICWLQGSYLNLTS